MKIYFIKKILFVLLSLVVYSASAQIDFNTGNAQLDSDLNTINANASANFGSFKADLSVNYNVSEKKIDYMRGSLNMAAGEIYISLEISKLSKTPIDDVLVIYTNNKSRGWGYIAKQAGIKPGSPEFHQLKNNARSKKNKKAKNKGGSKGKGNSKVKG
ncbi:hypothetical protein C9994_12430 [Marivirga lumbricoides]|uniref:Uncharacterized protein n=1 Tax=Marivirga lumbricoides TaxID=1046115 RepID=A0A2T4DJY5_9BACT|nr:hypothetical protein C9994_12430 [Marivirga lumbricoides]